MTVLVHLSARDAQPPAGQGTAVDSAIDFPYFVLPVTDAQTNLRVDLIFSFTPYEMEAIRRAVGVVFDTVTVRFASAEDLIFHKLVAGRPRDIEDVSGVLARNHSLDEVYLARWLTSFREVVQRDLLADYRDLRRATENSA
jgi:predicted nucleotidyltransferase